jgi:hypothetical protein
MEVHAPHHPLNSWRDFFIHIATITIGLLIAIGLEQTVELFHHRHMVHVARENIRRELEENERLGKEDIRYVQEDADRMKANLERARALRADSHALDGGRLRFTFTWSSLNDAAWRSARDSGALTYMPTDEVQLYADAYNQQAMVNAQAVVIFTQQIDSAATIVMEQDPSGMSREEIQSFMHDDAVVFGRLRSLAEIIQQLNQEYVEILKK